MTGTVSYRKQVKMSEIKKPKRHSPLSHGQSKPISSSIRERVLEAAFTLFREHGFSSTSMLDIVTRARVSKCDLCALFTNKHAVLAACISECAGPRCHGDIDGLASSIWLHVGGNKNREAAPKGASKRRRQIVWKLKSAVISHTV